MAFNATTQTPPLTPSACTCASSSPSSPLTPTPSITTSHNANYSPLIMGFPSSTGAPITSPVTGATTDKALDKQCPACTPLPPPEYPIPAASPRRIQGPRILTCGTGANSDTSAVCRLVESEMRKGQNAPTAANNNDNNSHYFFIEGQDPLKLTGEDHLPASPSSSSSSSSTTPSTASASSSAASSVSNASSLLASAIGSEGGRREDLGKRREQVVGEWQGRMMGMEVEVEVEVEKTKGQQLPLPPCRLPGGEWITLH